MSKRKAEEVAESIAKRAQSETDAVYNIILIASQTWWYGRLTTFAPNDVIKQLHADGKIYYTRLHYVRAYEADTDPMKAAMARKITACWLTMECKSELYRINFIGNACGIVLSYPVFKEAINAGFIDRHGNLIYDLQSQQVIDVIGKTGTTINQIEGLERLTKEGQIYHRDNHFKTTPFVPCKYGAGCYRIHNAEHMAEYIHPAVCYTVGEIIQVKLSSKHKGKVHLALIIDVNTDSVDIQWFYEVVDLKKAIRTQVLDGTHVYSDHVQLHFPIKDIITKVDPDTLNICYTYHFNTNKLVMDHCLD
jgi:hypothetical protein